ncbi:S-adenosylmethionine (SAM)-dependent methyltransferase [Listeria floridensis FSL S10-1187]|uniref:S-adenosylmethionine (SAM)-dependent methyltransferase n=1 Tax=Listeria floridensis FSL S10-1187 TaxID=1265817 RepID=A0ABP3B2M9_9LIST|nr:S-adenosylmethionine (SAM)-dependent methyltransferase [Listeria floridensis FSL S10-1187]
MNLLGIVPFSHELLKKVIFPGDAVLDGTCGNGHDTLFLAELVGPNGQVFGYDIQAKAIQITESRLEDAGMSDQVRLF